jgi:hypothetical protein
MNLEATIHEDRRDRGDMRIGQVIWNALAKAGRLKAPEANSLFYIEDDDLERLLYAFWDSVRKPGQ